MSRVAQSRPPEDGIYVEAYDERIVLTRFVGRALSVHTDASLPAFRRIISGMEKPVWLSDCRHLTGFEPKSLARGREWYKPFREAGGRDVLVVTTWSMAVMAGRSMGLGLGIRITHLTSMVEADRLARQLLDRE